MSHLHSDFVKDVEGGGWRSDRANHPRVRSSRERRETESGEKDRSFMDLGDASKITAVISHEFSALQLLGLQQIVYLKDLRLLAQSEQHWGNAQSLTHPVAAPKVTFNLKPLREAGPLAIPVMNVEPVAIK